MRELEEARLREEMTVREELEAHKATLDKIRQGRERCDESRQLEQMINRVGKKPRLLLPNYVRIRTHEELIRHSVRAKKAAQMDEDRISELEEELHRLHEEETDRIRQKEEEDRRREEKASKLRRYLQRVKADEDEMAVRQTDLEKLDREETKVDLQNKEDQLQDRLRRIKFEDDEHSQIEHDVEVLEKSREKFSGQENIEEEEIRTLSAKVDTRRIALPTRRWNVAWWPPSTKPSACVRNRPPPIPWPSR